MHKKRELFLPAACLLIFITLIFIYGCLQPFNSLVRDFVRATLCMSFFDVALFTHYLFETVLGTIQTIAWGAVIAFLYKDKKGAVLLVATVLAQSLTSEVTKALTRIPRPPQEFFGVFYHTYSYPSGHTATSLTFAIMLTCILCVRLKINYGRIISYLYFLLAVLTAYSRLFLDVHRITDILGGWALAGFITSLFLLYGRAFFKKAGTA